MRLESEVPFPSGHEDFEFLVTQSRSSLDLNFTALSYPPSSIDCSGSDVDGINVVSALKSPTYNARLCRDLLFLPEFLATSTRCAYVSYPSSYPEK